MAENLSNSYIKGNAPIEFNFMARTNIRLAGETATWSAELLLQFGIINVHFFV